jgi:hypothetical protein
MVTLGNTVSDLSVLFASLTGKSAPSLPQGISGQCR